MDQLSVLGQVRERMQVESSDGKTIGTVTRICCSDDESYLELQTSRWRKLEGFLYIPAREVADVSRKRLRKRVRLHIDASVAAGRTFKPSWISQPRLADVVDGDSSNG